MTRRIAYFTFVLGVLPFLSTFVCYGILWIGADLLGIDNGLGQVTGLCLFPGLVLTTILIGASELRWRAVVLTLFWLVMLPMQIVFSLFLAGAFFGLWL